jgi:hypothetical protein
MPDTVSPRPPDRIRTHLAKLLKSGVFAGSERLRRLLKFIVEQNLEFPNQPLYALGPNIQNAFEELDKAVTEARKIIKERIERVETPN